LETLILKGKVVSFKVKDELLSKIADLKSKGVIPSLAAIIVGDNPASKLYVSSKAKAFLKLGCYSEVFSLPKDTSKEFLINFIDELNKNKKFHGILLQLPLPKHLNEKEILKTISPKKDVDGLHPENQGYIMQGDPQFIPCTPFGCLQILNYYDIDIEGKDVVVVGRSNLVGKPIASLLSQNFSYGNATVTLCHTRTKKLESYTQKADIIIAAVGVPKLIKKNMIKKGVHIIDVGINRIDDASREKGYRVVGDVDFDDVLGKAASITPVPGGVGVMTVTMLLSNTVQAAINQNS
tara:strand:+ start:166 stop:1047 length:882 start_codon:yes stop_codon:yes gene_type:complete